MDKLIHDGRSVTISNDGATLIGLLDIVHPAAKTLVDIAQSQDNQVGDGDGIYNGDDDILTFTLNAIYSF